MHLQLPSALEDPLPLTLDIPNVQTICLGGTANLEVSSPQDPLNAWTYEWDNGLPNGPVSRFPPTPPRCIRPRLRYQRCPTSEYQVGVNVLAGINADLVASDFLCSGEEAFLDASATNGGSIGLRVHSTFEARSSMRTKRASSQCRHLQVNTVYGGRRLWNAVCRCGAGVACAHSILCGHHRSLWNRNLLVHQRNRSCAHHLKLVGVWRRHLQWREQHHQDV